MPTRITVVWRRAMIVVPPGATLGEAVGVPPGMTEAAGEGVVAAGVATIELAYRRAWESAPRAARTFVLHVTAKEERATK